MTAASPSQKPHIQHVSAPAQSKATSSEGTFYSHSEFESWWISADMHAIVRSMTEILSSGVYYPSFVQLSEWPVSWFLLYNWDNVMGDGKLSPLYFWRRTLNVKPEWLKLFQDTLSFIAPRLMSNFGQQGSTNSNEFVLKHEIVQICLTVSYNVTTPSVVCSFIDSLIHSCHLCSVSDDRQLLRRHTETPVHIVCLYNLLEFK